MSSSVIPNKEQEYELIQLTSIPFDDRANSLVSIEELDFGLMREHLFETKSKLYDVSSRMNLNELAQAMNLCEGANKYLFPKNIGLLMFTRNPNKYFHYIQIEVGIFPHGVSAKQFIEKTFEGPIQKQLAEALSYIKTNVIETKVIKYRDRPEADNIYNYPPEAIEEALANAVYHRNYEIREPIEVRVEPDAIYINSFNGVDPSLKQDDFAKGMVHIRRYRNRHIGSFLKELKLTEGKGTGIPTIYETMANNGSPIPVFDIDIPHRTYFSIKLPVHSGFLPEKSSGESKSGIIEKESSQIGGQVGSQVGSLTEKQKEVYNYIVAEPTISRSKLAEKMNINPSAEQKQIEALKKKGYIKRDSETTGYWKILIEE